MSTANHSLRKAVSLGLSLVACALYGAAALAQTVSESTLYNFTGGSDSLSPASALVQGSDGGLYGTTTGNFFTDYGSVYKISLSGTLTSLHHFTGGTDSATPTAPIALGSDGNLYGTTYGNLLTGTDGTVFKLVPAGGTPTNLFNFTGDANGGNPFGGLTEATSGLFYGATSEGGLNYGTLFTITSSGTLSTVQSLNSVDGAQAYTPPVEGSDGNFYGVTGSGGQNNFGTVYQLTPAGVFTTLYAFKGAGDGASPTGPLVEGPDGNFYGATSGSGAISSVANGSDGTIFKITPTGTLTTLHVFQGVSDGQGPTSLFLASDGNFYGTTGLGGAQNYGTVFEITAAGTFTSLYAFGATSSDGAAPQAGLIQASDGNFYGTTDGGGQNADGIVFKLTVSPALPAPVQLTASAASIAYGSPVTLSWQVLNAFSNTMQNCYANVSPAGSVLGAWSGRQVGTLNATTGIYSGSTTITPALPGSFVLGLTCGGMESAGVALTVGVPPTVQIITSSLPSATVGVAYTATLAAAGGTEPYTFSISSGTLPDGLSLDSATGVISGTPTAAAASVFTVQVKDSSATPETNTATFTIDSLVTLAITTTSLPQAHVGIAYSQTLAAAGGTPAYTWALVGNSTLPAGLSLSTAGVISGTPTTAGSTTFTVQVTDAANAAVQSTLSITVIPLIASSGTLTVSPSSVSIGQTTVATAVLTAAAGSPAMTGTIQFELNGAATGSPVTVSNGGATFTTSAFTATGTYEITAVYSGDANFEPAYLAPATVSVTTDPVLAISVNPGSVTLKAGTATSVDVTVLNANSSALTLSCGSLPSSVTCTFSSLGADGTAKLSISTETVSLLDPRGPRQPGNTGGLPAMLLPALWKWNGTRRVNGVARHYRRARPWLIVLLIGLGVAACGGGVNTHEAAPGTDVITVNASTGTQTASTQLTLILN